MQILKEFSLSQMRLQYLLEEDTRQVGLRMAPAGREAVALDKKRQQVVSLVQAHIAGDIRPTAYAGGRSLGLSGTSKALQFDSLREYDTGKGTIWETRLVHPEHGECFHRLRWTGGDYVYCSTEFRNTSSRPVTLEALSSFCIMGITPLEGGSAPGQLRLYRLLSAWSMEGRLQSDPLEHLNLEPSWAWFGLRNVRFGQAGSMPCNGYFPWAFLQDTQNRVFWGCQLHNTGAWQIEVSRFDDGVCLSGGLADYELGHWRKELLPGETFQTPEAVLTVTQGDTVLEAAQVLTAAMEEAPRREKGLPILYNEYCATWGSPSEEKVAAMVEALRGKPISYFVIDAGWYKPEDKAWDNVLGDWVPSKALFPQGLAHTAKVIREAGMVPGIWFEPENVGFDSQSFHDTAHLLHRDGVPITTFTRRFWDFRQDWVQNHLKERIIDFLDKNGFGYVKLDYNDTIGLGCDGAESLGEGLRQHMEGVTDFLQALRKQLPQLIVENCASGGHRLAPGWLTATEMSSFSDAHECVAIPIIAANLHCCLLPRQSQIWAVLRQTDDPHRLVYSLAATFLGRMCLSGDVMELSPEQWLLVDEAMDFYREVASIIDQGRSERFGAEMVSYNQPQGWQCVLRTGASGELLGVFHQFGGEPAPVSIPLAEGQYQIRRIYAVDPEQVSLSENQLNFKPDTAFSAMAVHLAKA